MKRVLIVDDAIVVHYILSHLLTNAGYEVVGIAEDGITALEMVAKSKPSIVLLDIGIPKKDGMQVLKEIKATSPEIRVIICSAVRLDPKVREAIRLGADGYIIKPIEADELIALLSRISGS